MKFLTIGRDSRERELHVIHSGLSDSQPESVYVAATPRSPTFHHTTLQRRREGDSSALAAAAAAAAAAASAAAAAFAAAAALTPASS